MHHHEQARQELEARLSNLDVTQRKTVRDCWARFAAAAGQNPDNEGADSAAYWADRMVLQYLDRWYKTP
jgi:putative NADPH-quinone reductase